MQGAFFMSNITPEGSTRPRYSTVDEVARYLGLTPKSVRNHIRNGWLSAYRLPNQRGVRLRLDEVDRELKLIPAGRVRLPRDQFGPLARIKDLPPEPREPLTGVPVSAPEVAEG